MNALQKALNAIATFLFPPHANCLACGAHRIHTDGPPLCEACQDALFKSRMPQNVCHKCGHILLTNRCRFCKTGVTKKLLWIRGAHQYKDAASRLIKRFKYSGVNAAGLLLVPDMVEAFINGHPPPIDMCTHVPMDQYRLRYRGANHAHILCEAFCKKTGLEPTSLLSASPTLKRQADLTKAQRLKNKKGVYTVIADVKGKHILLIDDVLTTGATVSACANALLKAGAASVSLLCAAIT